MELIIFVNFRKLQQIIVGMKHPVIVEVEMRLLVQHHRLVYGTQLQRLLNKMQQHLVTIHQVKTKVPHEEIAGMRHQKQSVKHQDIIPAGWRRLVLIAAFQNQLLTHH